MRHVDLSNSYATWEQACAVQNDKVREAEREAEIEVETDKDEDS